MDLGTIIHAVILLIFVLGFAYLIWATAAKSEGQIQSAGNLLAILVAAAGILVVVGMITAPMMGGRPFGIDMHHGASMSSDATPSAAPAADGAAAPAAEPSGDGGAKPGGKP